MVKQVRLSFFHMFPKTMFRWDIYKRKKENQWNWNQFKNLILLKIIYKFKSFKKFRKFSYLKFKRLKNIYF